MPRPTHAERGHGCRQGAKSKQRAPCDNHPSRFDRLRRAPGPTLPRPRKNPTNRRFHRDRNRRPPGLRPYRNRRPPGQDPSWKPPPPAGQAVRRGPGGGKAVTGQPGRPSPRACAGRRGEGFDAAHGVQWPYRFEPPPESPCHALPPFRGIRHVTGQNRTKTVQTGPGTGLKPDRTRTAPPSKRTFPTGRTPGQGAGNSDGPSLRQ